jgi:hypothetical protein
MNNDSKNEMNIDSSELIQNINRINLHYYGDYSLYKKKKQCFDIKRFATYFKYF